MSNHYRERKKIK